MEQEDGRNGEGGSGRSRRGKGGSIAGRRCHKKVVGGPRNAEVDTTTPGRVATVHWEQGDLAGGVLDYGAGKGEGGTRPPTLFGGKRAGSSLGVCRSLWESVGGKWKGGRNERDLACRF